MRISDWSSDVCSSDLVTLDDGHFYSKPALSTALAKGKVADTLVTTPAAKMVAQPRLDLRAGRAAEAIDAAGKVLLTTGGPIHSDVLVLALGADPVRPPLEGAAAHSAFAVHNPRSEAPTSELQPPMRNSY